MHAVMLGVARAAANIAGGTHHAFAGHGEGFCKFSTRSKYFDDLSRLVSQVEQVSCWAWASS